MGACFHGNFFCYRYRGTLSLHTKCGRLCLHGADLFAPQVGLESEGCTNTVRGIFCGEVFTVHESEAHDGLIVGERGVTGGDVRAIDGGYRRRHLVAIYHYGVQRDLPLFRL